MNVLMEYSKMRTEPNEYTWKTRLILVLLESYLGKYAQEVWETNQMEPDVHTMFLGTDHPKF